MTKSKFTEQKIVLALHQAESEVMASEVYLKLGISEGATYNWNKSYGGLYVSELRRLKMPYEEKFKLKQIVSI